MIYLSSFTWEVGLYFLTLLIETGLGACLLLLYDMPVVGKNGLDAVPFHSFCWMISQSNERKMIGKKGDSVFM